MTLTHCSREPEELRYTVSIVARQGCEELERCLESVRRFLDEGEGEVIVVDNGFQDECGHYIDQIAGEDRASACSTRTISWGLPRGET